MKTGLLRLGATLAKKVFCCWGWMVLSLLKARPTRPLEEVSEAKDWATAVGRPMACPCYFPLACGLDRA